MPPICLPLSRVRTLGRSLWRSPARKHRWPATACHNGFVAWPSQPCSPGSARILRASTKLDRFVILRCEFVFSLQDFVALLWSAQACLRFKGDGTFPSASKRQQAKQAAALQRAQWGCDFTFGCGSAASWNSWPIKPPGIPRISRKRSLPFGRHPFEIQFFTVSPTAPFDSHS